MAGQFAPAAITGRLGTTHAVTGLLKGLQPQNLDVTVFVRGGAVVAGDVLMFGFHTASDSAITSVVVGNAASIWRNVVRPTAPGIADGHPVGVALAVVGDDTEGAIRVFGVCPAFVIAASGNITVGDGMVCTASMNFDLVVAASERKFAIALNAATTPTTRELMTNVFVDGLGGGFGSV